MSRNFLSPFGKLVRAVTLAGVVSWTAGGCAESTAPRIGGVRVLLTDAPSDMISTAHVWISRIYLQGPGSGSEEGAPGRVDLFNDPLNPHVIDLLLLQDGVTADLTGVVDVDAASYTSLRFVVDSTHVVLHDGYQFVDGGNEGVFKVPSGGSSGIKVKLLDGTLEVGDDQIATITVDFPVDESFVIQQDHATGDVRRILFTPVLQQIPAPGVEPDPS